MESEMSSMYRSLGTREERGFPGLLPTYNFDGLGSTQNLCENCKHFLPFKDRLTYGLNVPASKPAVLQPRFQGRAITKKCPVAPTSSLPFVISPGQHSWSAGPLRAFEAAGSTHLGRFELPCIGQVDRPDYAVARTFAAAASPASASRRECRFCKSNGETPNRYSSHVLRNSEGRLICPILRKHICEVCGATGDNAHTRNYCPNRPLEVDAKRTAR